MFRFSLTTNQWRVGKNENKEVSFCMKSETFELSVNTGMHTKKRKFILCVPKMQIALVTIQRKIKFNVGPCDFAPKHFNLVPSFPGYKIAQSLFFDNRLFLVWLS